MLRLLALLLVVQTCMAASQWETARLIRPVFDSAFRKCNESQDSILFAKDNILPYVSCFNLNHQAPHWVANVLLEGQADESGRPDIDPWVVPDEIRDSSKLKQPNGFAFEEALGTRWDRGHLAPNSDMPDLKMKKETFNIINRAPQLAKINQGPWRLAEVATKDLYKTYRKNLVVVTTLIYEQDSQNSVKAREKRGGAFVDIPLSYNKIVYDIDRRVESSITLARAACITQSNRDERSRPSVLAWKECPDEVKSGFPEPRDIEDDSISTALLELLRQAKSL